MCSQDGILRLKNGKFEFKTVDSIFAGYFEDCQRLGRQHEVSHFRVLLPAQNDKTELVPMPSSMHGLDGASFLQKFGQPKGLPMAVADQEAEAPNDLVLLTLDLIEKAKTQERATKKSRIAVGTDTGADSENAADRDHDESDDDNDSSEEGGENDYDVLAKSDSEETQQFELLGAHELIEEHGNVAAAINKSMKDEAASACLQSQDCLSFLADHLQKQNAAAGLTRQELEEEAALLLVRHFQANKYNGLSLDSVGGTDAVISKALKVAGDAVTADLASEAPAASADFHFSGRLSGSESDLSDVMEDNDTDTASDCDDAFSPVGGHAGAPDHEGPQVPAPKFLLAWKQAFVSTEKALADRWERCKQPLGFKDKVAMVARLDAGTDAGADMGEEDSDIPNPRLCFVKWTDAARKEGRVVRLDSDYRVVYSAASLFGKKVASQTFNLPKFTCLLSTCGAASRKYRGDRGSLRDQLPPEVVRFSQVAGTLIGRVFSVPWSLIARQLLSKWNRALAFAVL